jgi:hypothetical protein
VPGGDRGGEVKNCPWWRGHSWIEVGFKEEYRGGPIRMWRYTDGPAKLGTRYDACKRCPAVRQVEVVETWGEARRRKAANTRAYIGHRKDAPESLREQIAVDEERYGERGKAWRHW